MRTLRLYDTYTRSLRDFRPLHAPEVGLYSCGPTVYDYAHIGNLRTYIFVDLLRRVLLFNGYAVKHVMNITDVGHLVSDADTGEDKMEAAQINDDLNLPRAVAVLWDLAKSDLPDATKKATMLHFDRVLGLGLAGWRPTEASVPADIRQLIQQRQQARSARQWPLADQLRARIGAAGYEVEDTPQGPQVHHTRTKESA